MRPWIDAKIPIQYLVVALVVALLGLLILDLTKTMERYPAYELQQQAAHIMQLSLQNIKELRQERGIPLSKELDPNETGIIGAEYTPLTTSLGKLDAKRTATNPDFAALMVRYFTELGLQKGDVVAIGASGSFPALIVATLSAVKVMGLRPLIIYSLGASMYGANIPELTFVQMLERLHQRGVLPYTLTAISLGGENDRAEGIFLETSQELIRSIADQARVEMIYETSIVESVQRRLEIFQAKAGSQPVRCFVNIGGASANYGNTAASLEFPNGLVSHPPKAPENPERGLLFEYAVRGIPIIHLLNINDLALQHGITVDPVPLPIIGRSRVYYQTTYYTEVSMITLVLVTLILMMPVWRRNRKA